MNILREVRRVKEKSMASRIRLLLAFCVIFIINTYAWFSTQKNVTFGGLNGSVTSWDVAYYINEDENQFLDQTAVLTIEELYPGMPNREDVVHIYNLGKASTKIKYELISVKVFGQTVWSAESENNSLQIQTTGNTTTLFSGDTTYPFNVSYTYDKEKLIGEYKEGNEDADKSQATFKFNVSWTYEGSGTEAENLARDILDTQFGKDAYAYYQDSANDPTKAIEVEVKITSSMIHPSEDPDYET